MFVSLKVLHQEIDSIQQNAFIFMFNKGQHFNRWTTYILKIYMYIYVYLTYLPIYNTLLIKSTPLTQELLNNYTKKWRIPGTMIPYNYTNEPMLTHCYKTHFLLLMTMLLHFIILKVFLGQGLSLSYCFLYLTHKQLPVFSTSSCAGYRSCHTILITPVKRRTRCNRGKSRQIAANRGKSRQIAANRSKSQQIAANPSKSQQIAANPIKSHQKTMAITF